MNDPHQTRVLIRTLPLSNWNYGGILQAYAMQEVLRNLGMNPVTDTSRIRRPTAATIRSEAIDRSQQLMGRTLPRLGRIRTWHDRATLHSADQRQLEKSLAKFTASHIDTVRLYRKTGTVDQSVLENIDAFVAGSDQIWRRQYSDVSSYLFDFLDNDDRVRISYAASFGVNDLNEYSHRLKRRSAKLAGRLTAISVREATAVELCREYWGVDAEQHLDPAMLLDRSHYDRLASTYDVVDTSGSVVAYLLDPDDTKNQLAGKTAATLGLEVFSVLPDHRDSAQPQPGTSAFGTPDRSRLPMEGWLKSFANAEFVVTDSFHGVVLSVLFNKPFIATTNAARGNSRFDSILEHFGLTSRLITPEHTGSQDLIRQEIDWASVNNRLTSSRTQSIAYLRQHLQQPGLNQSAA